AKTVSSPLHGGSQEMYVRMAGELDAEGRYLLLNAMANQLRYPNAHTYYFSCTLLTLFLESKSEGLKEQITRTLLERLIVNRPHPWGLLITFIELIKNRRYNFWAHSFTKCAPEIENLFTSVSRSCLGTNRAEEEAAAAAHAKEGVVPSSSRPTRRVKTQWGPTLDAPAAAAPAAAAPVREAGAPAAAAAVPGPSGLKDCHTRACLGVVSAFKKALRSEEAAAAGGAREPGPAGSPAASSSGSGGGAGGGAGDEGDASRATGPGGAHAAPAHPEAAAAAAAAGRECPPDTWELGRATWTFLHSVGAHYPERPSGREHVSANPPRVATAAELNLWLCGVHNEVNELLGKPLFDCSRIAERWREGPKDGSCD
ncbi:CCR4-NOT transcription complex subunit 1, partial [Tetrabaena socialis]